MRLYCKRLVFFAYILIHPTFSTSRWQSKVNSLQLHHSVLQKCCHLTGWCCGFWCLACYDSFQSRSFRVLKRFKWKLETSLPKISCPQVEILGKTWVPKTPQLSIFSWQSTGFSGRAPVVPQKKQKLPVLSLTHMDWMEKSHMYPLLLS